MYTALLTLHSWLRYLVLGAGLVAVILAWRGWLGDRPWPAGEKKRANLIFVIALDLQLVVGLLLYVVLSPATQAAFADFGAAMKDRGLRFFAVEHLFGMVLALVFAHLGHALSKRAPEAAQRYKRAALFFTLALVAIVASIPWPGLDGIGRPLFRLGG
ncbi:MAG: hypothetical protein D6729_01870 [Deltaproteobacteria bacterium]|nr:MAG: hypothetical protein D6729_01870 [Deltaproteobacteria bacterium]